MAGPDPLDATTAPVAVRADLSQVGPEALQGLRIGVPAEYFHPPGAQVSESDSGWAEVEARLNDALGAFERHGARLLPIHLPNTAHALPVYYIVAPAEASANLARFDGIRYGPRLDGDTLTNVFTRTRGQLFGPEVKRRIMLGTYALSTGYYDAYYNQAQKVRTLIRRDFDAAFQQVDIILTPVTPTTAFRFGEYAGDPLAMYRQDIDTLPASLAGIPGISLPCGFDRDGLPVGMQLLAAHFQEERLLQTAHAYQQITAWHTRQPALNT
jgi:aspartyl-tRNA(Asn)/glutamyl-tRNA(Gln) amidotransferase subunit A